MRAFVLLLLVLSAFFIGTASAKVWYFTDSASLDGKLMGELGEETKTCVLKAGESIWWYSEPVDKDTMYYGNWKVIYYAETNSENSHWINVRLYKISNGQQIEIANRHNTLKKSDGIREKERELETHGKPKAGR